jgi:hypothetical protein
MEGVQIKVRAFLTPETGRCGRPSEISTQKPAILSEDFIVFLSTFRIIMGQHSNTSI